MMRTSLTRRSDDPRKISHTKNLTSGSNILLSLMQPKHEDLTGFTDSENHHGRFLGDLRKDPG